MIRKSMVALLLFLSCIARAQPSPAIIDSLKTKFSKASTSNEKVELLGVISRVLMTTNIAEADKYGKMMKEEAELSRNRSLMVRALYINGLRYSYLATNKEFAARAIEYYNSALELAKQNRLDKQTAEILIGFSSIYLQVHDLDKALSYTTQAESIVSTINNDTLKITVLNSYGDVYLLKKQRIDALRYYLGALHTAEEIKKPSLLGDCYKDLMGFYADLKEYDKAIDYAQAELKQLDLQHEGREAYQKVVDLFYIGNLYVAKKDFDMSVYYFEKSLRLADSLDFAPLKMTAYQGLLSQYMSANQPQSALNYLNGKPELRAYINGFGMGYEIDRFYAVIYRDLGKFDSAKYYFDKAAPAFEAHGGLSGKISFYSAYAKYFKRSGNNDSAIGYYLKAMNLASLAADLEEKQNISKELDTLYAYSNDYKQSYYYNTLYHQYRDSLQKLSEEKEVMRMETEDEAQRLARIEKEKAAALERRHSVEYTGIAIGIAMVFILLVAMGMFRVSEATIRIMGFFAFILLFEFIVLLADTRIHEWTQGEPLPVLGIKIVLIAFLLPLHHWLEHKVVQYLASRRLIIPEGKSLWKQIRKRPERTERSAKE